MGALPWGGRPGGADVPKRTLLFSQIEYYSIWEKTKTKSYTEHVKVELVFLAELMPVCFWLFWWQCHWSTSSPGDGEMRKNVHTHAHINTHICFVQY